MSGVDDDLNQLWESNVIQVKINPLIQLVICVKM